MKNNQPEQLLLPIDLESEIRNLNGYFQFLQEYEQQVTVSGDYSASIIKAKWMFYVTGFISNADKVEEYCHVLMFDRSKTVVPIDNKGRITINGKKYSKEFWEH